MSVISNNDKVTLNQLRNWSIVRRQWYCFFPLEMQTNHKSRPSLALHAGRHISFPDRRFRRLLVANGHPSIPSKACHFRVMLNMTPSRCEMVVLVPSTSSTSIPRFSASFSSSASMLGISRREASWLREYIQFVLNWCINTGISTN